ncbi:cytochrome c-type biogenesis protein CcmH [Pseudahrensia aquimaris]|uniref:Cytochrome c-type biogenesis protein n=1 Tax=Pseudahrensia aquimaris TaxID=744461 RepID=A0ABW3FBK7_9HYPH
MPRGPFCTLLACIGLLVSVTLSLAADNVPLNANQEAQAKDLFTELRCVVCQNQSIADSDAEVARDLRQVVREQIAGGATNSEVKNFLVSRYGEFILLKPSWAAHTFVLWISPLLFLLFGLYWILRSRTTSAASVAPLSSDEQRKLDELLKKQ